jgi:hypothetical protein
MAKSLQMGAEIRAQHGSRIVSGQGSFFAVLLEALQGMLRLRPQGRMTR